MSNCDIKHCGKRVEFKVNIHQKYNITCEGLITGVVGKGSREMYLMYALTGPAGREFYVVPEDVIGEIVQTTKVVPLED